jgi:hypothetical protein
METFMAGMVTAGFLLGGLFFARYWSRSRDPIFAAFTAAFWLLALNQFLLVFSSIAREERSWIYLLRLAAFTLIAVAIAYKNGRKRSEQL